MNLWWLAVLVLVLVAAVALWKYAGSPLKHRNLSVDQLRKYFDVLIDRGYPNGFMIIEVPQTAIFLQFVKEEGDEQSPKIRCDFPLAPWSREYYVAVARLASELNLSYRETSVGDNPKEVQKFLHNEFGSRIALASRFVSRFLGEVVSLAGRPLTVYFRGVAPG